MTIREAGTKDIEAIAKLHAESWRVAYRGQYADAFLDGPVFQYSKDVWQKRLTLPVAGQHTIVAEEDGTLAGFACAFGGEDLRWGTLLDNIHVDPERKREGIGLQLILEVAAWADRAYHATGFYLWVIEANAPARRFYERLGAHNAEQTTFEPPGGGSVRILRYAWATPRALLDAAR